MKRTDDLREIAEWLRGLMLELGSQGGQAERLEVAADRIDELEAKVAWLESRGINDMQHCIEGFEAAMREAIADIEAEHYRYDPRQGPPDYDALMKNPPPEFHPKARLACVSCYPSDSSWPCAAANVAIDLQAALDGLEPA